MSTNPFEYSKSINEKTKYIDHVRDYNAYLTNQALSYSMDTILLANEMNMHPNLPADCQYDFLYDTVRKGRRYNKWYKPEEIPHLETVMEYYGYSKSKALQALQILTSDQIRDIIKSQDTGGRS